MLDLTQPTKPSLARSVLAVSVVIAMTSALSVLAWWQNPLVIAEHQGIEIAQAVLLLLACVMHSIRAFRLPPGSIKFFVHAGLALLTFSFAVRELDISRFGEALVWSTVQRGVQLFGLALWAAFLFWALKHLKSIYRDRNTILYSPTMVLTIAGGAFFIAGWPFDKKLFLLSQEISQLIEETLELNASVLLAMASVADSTLARFGQASSSLRR